MAFPLTFLQAKARLGAILHVDSTTGDYPTLLGDWLNTGGDRVWRARPWYGRDVETIIFTVAPYSTGTADFTQGSTAVSGSGTTWTAAMSGSKIALAIGQPYYIFTRTGNTTGTIPTGGYAEATATGSGYTIFQDEYDLPSAADFTTLSVEPLYSWRTIMRRFTMQQLDDLYYVQRAQGPPVVWGPTLSRTASVRRIRFAPVPDAIYRFRVRYLSSYTNLSADGDTSVLGGSRERAWILASALEAQRAADARIVTSETEVQNAIEEAWQKERPMDPTIVRRVPLGSGRRWPAYPISDDNPFG